MPTMEAKDLIALAKTKGGGLSYASSGAGSIVHLATEYFLSMAGVKAVHVPYKGTGPAIIDTIAGNTQFLFGSIGAVMPQVKSGKLRGIAVTGPKRISALPDVATITESGVKGYEVINWHGLIGPKGLPQPIVGLVIIRDLAPDDGRYKGGTILDPEDGKVYKAEIWAEGGTLKVRGYVGLFYKTQSWVK